MIETTLIFAEHEIHTPTGEFITSENINAVTGEFDLVAVKLILAPGRIHEIPKSLADEIFAMAEKQQYPCARALEERELLSWQQSRGQF
ncbi:hypothetical protein [Novosphingobium sp.]|uniref:hypothetical protein n=1 Tax=Novosphingobium sp. TaxID=1874826 RepID=UPI003B5170E4